MNIGIVIDMVASVVRLVEQTCLITWIWLWAVSMVCELIFPKIYKRCPRLICIPPHPKKKKKKPISCTGIQFLLIKSCNSTFTRIELTLRLLCRNHRGLRHYWGLRVRGQHTKTTGRRGKTVGVSKKRWAFFFLCFKQLNIWLGKPGFLLFNMFD